MINENFYTDYGDKDVELLIPVIINQTTQQYGKSAAESCRWRLFSLMSDINSHKIILKQKGEKQPIGLCIFGKNEIHFFYLTPEITERKMASYILVNSATERIMAQKPEYVVVNCPGSPGCRIDDEILQNLSFYDFFDMLMINLQRDVKNMAFPDKLGYELFSHLSFYSFFQEEHHDAALGFMCTNPDSFTERLFAGKSKETLCNAFYEKNLFSDTQRNGISFNPDLSTIVFDPENKCRGLLLCGYDGVIKYFRAGASGRAGVYDIMSELLSRTLINCKPQYKSNSESSSPVNETIIPGIKGFKENIIENPVDGGLEKIFISVAAKEKKLTGWLKKSGFAELGEYRAWGWAQPD
jgi:hypothetical protein